MNAIFKKENVYVAIKGKDTREDIQCEEMDTLIFATHYEYEKQKVYLYGGRVYLENYGYNGLDVKIFIDGIPIREIGYNKEPFFFFQIAMTVGKATAFLNQIENLGIDSFLENYKNQLQEFKKDLEAQAEKIEQEQSAQLDEDKSTFLVSLRRFINELSCIIFCLLINMNAGLDNQFYTDAYNEIINLYF
jgi:hypothetical protein